MQGGVEMQILPNHYYRMIMRHGGWEKRGRCLHLQLKKLLPEEKESFEGIRDESDMHTHRVTFYDFECHRILEGKIKEETEDVLVLDLGGGKEYEFSLFKPACRG